MTTAGGGPVADVVPLRAAAKVWALVALQSFGGPAGQIAVMDRLVVEERRWVGRRRFLHALGFVTLLPGPEAQQLAVYLGWLLNGVRGGLLAGSLFVLPGMLAVLALSAVYVVAGDTGVVLALFAGVAPAVLVVVAQAVLRLGRRAVRGLPLVGVAVAAFLALAVFAVPFPVVVVLAGVTGWLLGRVRPSSFDEPEVTEDEPAALVGDEDEMHGGRPGRRRAVTVLAVGVLAWGVPLGLVVALLGAGSTVATEGLFFSGTALVTFGGAYAVLAYVAQRAVEDFGWLGPQEMVRGLALAESTPGPLIMVVQFVAFLGAYRDPGGLDPWVAATLGALLTTWVTFVPSFTLVLLGAPYVERLRHHRGLRSTLAGVMAAVVGVIANLALYFATHTLFDDVRDVVAGPLRLQVPEVATLRLVPLAVAVMAAVALLRWRWSVLRTLALGAGLGLIAGALGLPVA